MQAQAWQNIDASVAPQILAVSVLGWLEMTGHVDGESLVSDVR